MLTLLFYQPTSAEGPRTTLADVEAALCTLPGVSLDGSIGAAYRPGRWHSDSSGARCTIDLGAAPLPGDPLHPPRAYDGWNELALCMHIPLSGPHWLCVETLQLVESLLSALPDLQALDTEDVHSGDQPGPHGWNRARVLASWERQHAAQHAGRSDAWRMNRLASVCMWRYRRERAEGVRRYGHWHWPDVVSLLDLETHCVRSAAFWQDPAATLVLPPVELLIVRRGAHTGVLVAADLAAFAKPDALPIASAASIPASAALSSWLAAAPVLPTTRFRAVDDYDWSD
jgi:hypothetical protein